MNLAAMFVKGPLRAALLFIILSSGTAAAQPVALTTAANEVVEWGYTSETSYGNPFRDVSLYAEITGPDGAAIMLPAFWAGGAEWRFRFSAPEAGAYRFTTTCTDEKNEALHAQSGTITITPYEGTNTLLQKGAVRVADDNRHLVYGDGTPFFWLADSWWHGMTERFIWPDDFQYLTQDRKEKGFSVIQFAIGFPCDIDPFDPRGRNEAGDPWDSNWVSINPEYFDLADQRVQYLVEQGLVPNILGSWGYYIKWAGAENMKKHWEYLIARYGAYPVVWTLAGEVTLAWYFDLAERWEEEKKMLRREWSKVAEYIQTADPYGHILTVHPGPNSGDLKPIDAMEQIDMVMLQSGHSGYYTFERSMRFVEEAMELYPEKPVLHGEVCFEGIGGKSLHDVQRFLFWSNMLEGTAGFSYGVEGIWQFNTEEELFGPSPLGDVWGNVPWETAAHYLGSTHVGSGRRILERFDWWELQPARERITPRSDDPTRVPFCAEIPGQAVLVYTFEKPTGWKSVIINGFEAGEEYEVAFHDPHTGDIHSYETVRANEEGVITFTDAPIKQDWVIEIRLR